MRIALIVFLAASACADLSLGETRVKSVCVDGAPLAFTDRRGGEAIAEIDLGPFDLDVPDERRATLASATLTADSGVADLGFAERVRLSLVDAPAGELTFADGAVAGRRSVEVDGDPDVDVAGPLRDGASTVEIAVMGDAPTNRWNVLIDLCFEIE